MCYGYGDVDGGGCDSWGEYYGDGGGDGDVGSDVDSGSFDNDGEFGEKLVLMVMMVRVSVVVVVVGGVSDSVDTSAQQTHQHSSPHTHRVR